MKLTSLCRRVKVLISHAYLQSQLLGNSMRWGAFTWTKFHLLQLLVYFLKFHNFFSFQYWNKYDNSLKEFRIHHTLSQNADGLYESTLELPNIHDKYVAYYYCINNASTDVTQRLKDINIGKLMDNSQAAKIYLFVNGTYFFQFVHFWHFFFILFFRRHNVFDDKKVLKIMLWFLWWTAVIL